MKNDEILLNEIYENSITAINVISGLLRKTNNQSMFDCLFEEMTEYRKIADTAYKLFEKSPTIYSSLPYSQIAVLASVGKPSCHRIARILISGSTEGFFSLIDSVNSCTGARKEVRHLAYKLMEIEDKNINTMKTYLKK